MKIIGVPTLKDPRVLIIAFFTVIVSYALSAAGFTRTFPSDRKRQLVNGAFIALLDNVLRQQQVRGALPIALFLVCGGYNLFRAWRPDVTAFNVWKTKGTYSSTTTPRA